jgi:hypothetical protein
LIDLAIKFAIKEETGGQSSGLGYTNPLAITQYSWEKELIIPTMTTTVMLQKYMGYVLDETNYPRLNRLKVKDLCVASCFSLDFKILNSSDVSDLVFPNLKKICSSAQLLSWIGEMNTKFGFNQYYYFMSQIGTALFYIYRGCNNRYTFNSNVANYDSNTTIITIYNDSMTEYSRKITAFEALCKYAIKNKDEDTLNSVWTMFCSDPRWFDPQLNQLTYTLVYPNLANLIKQKNISLWNIIQKVAPAIDEGFQFE